MFNYRNNWYSWDKHENYNNCKRQKRQYLISLKRASRHEQFHRCYSNDDSYCFCKSYNYKQRESKYEDCLSFNLSDLSVLVSVSNAE